MDKEDCVQALLLALQLPRWKACDSITDWDLKNVLWKAGLLLTPEQVAALFSDMKRRGLIQAVDRRSENRIIALWGVKIAAAGEEWLAQRAHAASRTYHSTDRDAVPAEQVLQPSAEHLAAEPDSDGHPADLLRPSDQPPRD